MQLPLMIEHRTQTFIDFVFKLSSLDILISTLSDKSTLDLDAALLKLKWRSKKKSRVSTTIP